MADNYNIEEWKAYFVKMAKGEIPYSKFYVVNNKTTTAKKDPSLKLVTPTEQAVEQAKSEIKSKRGIKRSYEEDPIIIRDNKRKPPGSKHLSKNNKQIINRRPLWN